MAAARRVRTSMSAVIEVMPEPAAVRFAVLGPLQVVDGLGTVRPVSAAKQRIVLAALLMSGGKMVSAGELAEALWDACPSPNAPTVVRTYVARLRRALGPAGARIVGQPSGWAVELRSPEEFDLAEVDWLWRTARVEAEAGQWQRVSSLLGRALSLWRGEPLADILSDALVRREANRLTELRLQLTEARIDADLRLGRHGELVAELQRLAAEYPLREHIRAQLMLACYRCGHQAAALEVYRDARAVLDGELGVEPGRELRELHQQILVADPVLSTGVPGGPVVGPSSGRDLGVLERQAVPRQLPAGPASFTGRSAELSELSAMAGESAGLAGTVVVTAIGGMAGVGKTALALHWAHQVASRFPDGQLYAGLRGFDPSGRPATAAEAIRGMLDALGVPAGQIPSDLDAQAGLYRSLLAGRRMLIVLDNARDEQQVRPLLPAAEGCLVIVTSRNRLAGLAASHAARLLSVDLLSDQEACALLAARLGNARAAAESGPVSELAALCGGLPLALAIAAARAVAHPARPLAALAAELRDASSRLDGLDAGEPATSVRAVFSWSCQQLTSSAAGMFWLLGIHPGPDITAAAAASLAGVGLSQARAALAELTATHLVTEHAAGRYALHDLLRAYAAAQAHAEQNPGQLHAATGRLLDHYLHTAHAAARQLNWVHEPITLAAPGPGTTPEQMSTHQQALAWFEAEHKVLLAVVSLAVEAGFDTHAWQLPWTLTNFFDLRGHWHHWAATQHAALAAAQRLNDLDGQACAHHSLGKALIQLCSYDDGSTHLRHALAGYRQLGDQVGEAYVHLALSVAFEREERYRETIIASLQGLKLFEAAGMVDLQAVALSNAAQAYAYLGEFEQALTYCQQALELHHQAPESYGEAAAWDTLGYIRQHTGRHAEAVRCYEQALALFRERGNRWFQATTFTNIGDAHHATGDSAAARHAWQQALDIFDDLHHPVADLLRAKLNGQHPPPATTTDPARPAPTRITARASAPSG
jgi:DNA-binding SARP family transcriptional activator/tetratricopeptide (TPR) repeat protein